MATVNNNPVYCFDEAIKANLIYKVSVGSPYHLTPQKELLRRGFGPFYRIKQANRNVTRYRPIAVLRYLTSIDEE
jgi:hypothetical protein